MAVGLTADDGSRTAFLAVFDVARPRFLSGAVEIGAGRVEPLVAGANGTVWAALPWSGAIVRARPR